MTVIIKLGGSLLSLPGLATRLRIVVECRPNDHCLVIVGGGSSADIVRTWSEIHGLGDESAHWLALSSLDLNRRLLQELTGWTSVASRDRAVPFWRHDNRPLLLDLRDFSLVEESTAPQKLPHTWDVTSDSLAAWVASRWPADELILLKSVDVPRTLNADSASQSGLVDAFFPVISAKVSRISWCNLRSTTISVAPWLEEAE